MDPKGLKELKDAVAGVLVCVCAALAAGAAVWHLLGAGKATEFFGGYLIELSLSIDNLFVFIMIFTSYGVSGHAQRKALNYGIAGAVVLRFLFIFFGVRLVSRFEWILYIFGVVLIVNGILMCAGKEKVKEPKDNTIVKLLMKTGRVAPDFTGEKFFSRKDKKIYATPLLVVVVMIEFSDILFAVDSVPAIFSISTDLLIVYSSNILAILGLRQFYFVLRHFHSRFAYVKYGVAILLIFTGAKLGIGVFGMYIDTLISIIIIFSVLVLSISASIIVSSVRQRKLNRA